MGRVMKEVLKSFSLVQAFLLALYFTRLQILNESWCLNEPEVKIINGFILIMACVVTETYMQVQCLMIAASKYDFTCVADFMDSTESDK